MGKRLGSNDSATSMNAINLLRRDAGGKVIIIANIRVYDSSNDRMLLHFNKSKVQLGIDSQCYKVYMFWEDYGLTEEYHDLGLWGYYSTDFIKMEYDELNKYLRINAIDDDKIIEIQL